jgi:hypothetical protein
MRHTVKTHNQSILNNSSGIQSVLSRFQDKHSVSQLPVPESLSQVDIKKIRPMQLPSMKESLSKGTQKRIRKMDTQMEEFYHRLMANMKEGSRAEGSENGIFPTDKLLRHPLKDGLKLMLIGEELNRDHQDLEPIRLLSDAIATDHVERAGPTGFFIQKLPDIGILQ